MALRRAEPIKKAAPKGGFLAGTISRKQQEEPPMKAAL